MLSEEQWHFDFVAELRLLAEGSLDLEAHFMMSVSRQQWGRLSDENPKLVARRWASRAGLLGGLPPSSPTMLIWQFECAEELQRQQPWLPHHVAKALALLQWDMHADLTPTEAALRWIATHPHGTMDVADLTLSDPVT